MSFTGQTGAQAVSVGTSDSSGVSLTLYDDGTYFGDFTKASDALVSGIAVSIYDDISGGYAYVSGFNAGEYIKAVGHVEEMRKKYTRYFEILSDGTFTYVDVPDIYTVNIGSVTTDRGLTTTGSQLNVELTDENISLYTQLRVVGAVDGRGICLTFALGLEGDGQYSTSLVAISTTYLYYLVASIIEPTAVIGQIIGVPRVQ